MDESIAQRWGLALPVLIALPFVCALLLAMLRVRARAWIPLFVVVALEFLGFGFATARGISPVFHVPWIPRIGAEIALRLDGLALLFGLLIPLIGLAIIGYSALYIPHHIKAHRTPRSARDYYLLLALFVGSMLGLVVADDLFTLYLFWEATSVTSLLLIAFDLDKKARRAALKAFAITAASGLLLFVAFVAISIAAGHARISLLTADSTAAFAIRRSGFSQLVVIGFLLGVFAKSAQLPLHAWLPDAMIAPTPVSAYLHSATMVAAGVFLMARLSPLFFPLPGYAQALVVVGSITMLSGAWLALTKQKLKAILAYSTISQYGYITVLLGLGAHGAAAFLVMSHALIKAGLFLVAGAIIYTTGRDDLRGLGGLSRRYPILATLAFVLTFSLAGIIPSSGFWMKELFYRAVLDAGSFPLLVAAVFTGTLTIAYMLRFFLRIFVGRVRATGHEDERDMRMLLAPIGLLALLSLFFGLFPSLGTFLSDKAASSAAMRSVTTPVSLHFPPDSAMWLTILSFALGVGLQVWTAAWEKNSRSQALRLRPGDRHVVREASAGLARFSPSTLSDAALDSLPGLGRFLGRVHTGKLLHYLLALVFVAFALVVWRLLPSLPSVLPAPRALAPISHQKAAFVALSVSALLLCVASTIVRSQLGVVLMVSGVGFVLAGIFAVLRAPDVALVQVTVETITGVVTLLVISRVRTEVRKRVMGRRGLRSRAARSASTAAACAIGISVAAFVLAIGGVRSDPLVGKTLLQAAADEGVRDVVTHVLVDFRGLDTLGEITVFLVGVLGTVHLIGAREEKGDDASK